MGTFRYYLPKAEPNKAGRVDIDVVKSRGLWDRLDDSVTGHLARDRYSCNPLAKGPDGGQGLLIVPEPHDGTPVERAEFVPEHQTWLQSERGNYWIGTDNDHPPTPAGLVRRRVVEGYEHELGDGNLWECPIIRRAIILPAVPCSYSRMNGELTHEPLPEYAPIFQRTLRFASEYAAGSNVPIPDQWELAIACLAINYRVGDEEVSLLRLLNDRTLKAVLDAAFDIPWLRAALDGSDTQKKRAWDSICAAAACTSPGDPASSPDTNPPPQTSS